MSDLKVLYIKKSNLAFGYTKIKVETNLCELVQKNKLVQKG